LRRFMTGAHACRHDEYVVARSDSSIRTPVAHKRAALIERKIIRQRGMQIFRKLAHDRNIVGHVVVRDLFALTDAERGSDRLSKLQHKLASRNVSRSEAMARGDLTAHFDG